MNPDHVIIDLILNMPGTYTKTKIKSLLTRRRKRYAFSNKLSHLTNAQKGYVKRICNTLHEYIDKNCKRNIIIERQAECFVFTHYTLESKKTVVFFHLLKDLELDTQDFNELRSLQCS